MLLHEMLTNGKYVAYKLLGFYIKIKHVFIQEHSIY